MPTHQKAYRYRLVPTPAQESLLQQFAGARRWVYNWSLARRQEHYRAMGKTLTVSALCAELVALKQQPAMAWLAAVDSQALQQAIRDLDQAFQGFFERRARYPRFRSKKRDTPSFRIPQRVVVRDGHVVVPKIGFIRMRQHRPLDGETKSATFKRDASGHWYVTLVVHFELPDTPLPAPDPARTSGLDAGLKDVAVLSDGTRFPAPRYYRHAERKLRRLQRHLSRTKAGGCNREKARRKVARQHQKVAHQRKDFLHKLTTGVVNQNDAICIEDLSLKGLAKTKLSKSVRDAGLGQMRFMLTYKTAWRRKHLAIIDRFYPSSRLCDVCGARNNALTLADRVWVCACGATHDRDLTAARNIRQEGLRLLAAGYPESRNAF
jgi:putative transposase